MTLTTAREPYFQRREAQHDLQSRTVNQADDSAHKPFLPLVKACNVVTTLLSQVLCFSEYTCKLCAKAKTETKIRIQIVFLFNSGNHSII